MNEPYCQLTENLHRGLEDRGAYYETRYEAMYAHARELERQLKALRNEDRVPGEQYRHLLTQFVLLNRLIRVNAKRTDDAELLQTCLAASEAFFSEVAAICPNTATELRSLYYRE